jgi:Gnt-I system high-affinity gluconate transporter
MTLLIVIGCIITLVLLITWAKFNPFLAFLVVSILTGIALGIPLTKISTSITVGIGDTLGSLVIIVGLGAMLGKLVAESGAAQKITTVLMRTFGEKYLNWALMITGFVVGIPLFYNVGFVLLVPLIFSVVYQYKLPAVYTGVPMLAALSVTHGFLPPHPSPTALVAQFHANMGLTLMYGFILAIPAIIVAGPLFARTLKNLHSEPLQTFRPVPIAEDKLPGITNCLITALLPVILLARTQVLRTGPNLSPLANDVLTFLGDPVIVMLISVLVASFSLGVFQGRSMKNVMNIYGEAVKDVALILLIVAGAGVLKQIFIDSGVSKVIAESLQGISIHPLILGWLIAAIIRVCIGSATVAGLTTAGIIAPLLPKMIPGSNPAVIDMVNSKGISDVWMHTDPNLMVLSIGAGSLMFSHVNDSGFWMFKEYFNLSIKDTIRSWSIMETIVAIVGLIGVLILDLFI